MASWGDVDVYNEMIDDLGTFCTELTSACETMVTAANACANIMENDKAALSASKNVALSVQQYGEARELAQNLMRALAEERDEIIEYLKTLDELDD